VDITAFAPPDEQHPLLTDFGLFEIERFAIVRPAHESNGNIFVHLLSSMLRKNHLTIENTEDTERN
jgi:hypothetical protein